MDRLVEKIAFFFHRQTGKSSPALVWDPPDP